ncbi:hypothetical protein F4804DRAFT_187808 [Jackrogersella minutella]|nr:hypothetical protein F4804DRAFT_187808 [Jackrogersella minutella]
MGDEDLQAPLSVQFTLVSRSSTQNLATSTIRSDSCSLSTSTKRRIRSRVRSHTSRTSRLKRYYHSSANKRKSNLSHKSSIERDAYSQSSSATKQGVKNRHLEHIFQRLAEMDMRQERLLTILQSMHDNNKESPGLSYSQSGINRFQPRLDLFSSSSLQKYLQVTLHPDPVRICDMFLARYNLPHILSGSYDPIELMHMHGWEQEGCGDITLVVQKTGTDEESKALEVPWKHIDQTREPHLALELTQVAALIKENWLYQGRSIRNPDEVDVPFETDEFADSVLFLNCPGYTKALLYQSGYDSSGSHLSREPWLSGKRSLLCQLQVISISRSRSMELTEQDSLRMIDCVLIDFVLGMVKFSGDYGIATGFASLSVRSS